MSRKDGGWGWVVVFAGFFSGFVFDGISYSYGLIYIELLDTFNESKALTAGIGSVLYSMAMLSPLAGMFVNRFGCRVTNVVAGAIYAVGCITSAFSTGVLYLYVSIGIFLGLGFTTLELTRTVVIVQYFDKRRSLARGLSMCGSGVGTIVFLPLSRWLIDEYGWRGALLIEGGLALNIVACGLLMRPFSAQAQTQVQLRPVDTSKEGFPMDINVKPSSAKTNFRDYYYAEETQTDRSYITGPENIDPISRPFRRPSVESFEPKFENKQSNSKRCLDINLLKNKYFLVVFFSTFFLGMAYFASLTFIPHLVVSSGWTRNQATWLMTGIGIANTFSRIILGLFLDMKCLNRVLVHVLCLFSLGALIISMPFCHQYSTLLAVGTVFGGLTAGQAILPALIHADLFGEKLIADTHGLTMLALGVGNLIVGPSTGAIFDASGSYITAFIAIGAAYVLSGALYIPVRHKAVRKTKTHRSEEEF